MALELDTVRKALSDRYAVEREVGRGGMAAVYRGRDAARDRAVAIKVLRPEFAVSVGVERFRQEIAFLAELDHPNILPVLDSGEAHALVFYTMPYAGGGTLGERLAGAIRLPVAQAVAVAGDVAAALAYAHARNIVHRDIKPDNIMFDEDGRARVCDFGVARAIERAAEDRISSSGLVVGTPAYMSPEQAAGESDLDGRSDIYSLACVVYEMLVGEPPFTGRTAQTIMARHVHERPPRVRVARPEVPGMIEAALLRALAKDPAHRQPTAEALARELTQP